MKKKSNYIEINGRRIGPDYAPLVIAELGINHEGSLQTAFGMVDAAARVGIEVIKHQTHIVEDEMCAAAKKVIPGNAQVSIYDIMKRCSLSESDEIRLQKYVESKGLLFISTPFSRAAVDRLQRMDVPAFKVGSGECNNYPLLEHIARLGKPVILSTGMNTLESIAKAVKIFDQHRVLLVLLHTTNLYPTPSRLVRLGAMQQLAAAFPDKVYGLSDHTTSNLACQSAIALGASVVERHFTDNMQRPGPDIVCSMDEQAARELVESSRVIYSMLGGDKKPAVEEQITIDFAYSTLVTIRPIHKGEPFTTDNLWVKRPGMGGILAEAYDGMLGRRAAMDLEADVQLVDAMIEKATS